MRLGLLCTADVATAQAINDYVEFNVEAEALGFTSTFLVEHHFSGWNQVAATLMLQTCVATRTSTLRLGTGVMVLSWHNPVLPAEQAATLDVISGGRLDLGVGKGYRHSEFQGFNLDQREADPRFEEALDVLLRAWCTRERFSHRGRFWAFDDIVVEPPRVQSPHPPIWIAAASETSVRRAGSWGHSPTSRPESAYGIRRDALRIRWRSSLTATELPIRVGSRGRDGAEPRQPDVRRRHDPASRAASSRRPSGRAATARLSGA